MIIKALFFFLLAFVISFLISPLVIKCCKKFKAKQTILHYVDAHKSKQGTPTMGGIIFIVGSLLAGVFIFTECYTLALLSFVAMISYGSLGFLDDFIKIKEKQNEGLLPYQKIIGQVGLGLIFAIFVYKFVGTSILIPFSSIWVDIGVFVIPLTVLVFVALVNSVNLIDGLDGLCSGVSLVYLLGFAFVFSLGFDAMQGKVLLENQNLFLACFCLVGALLAFIIYNGFPASIFMGDTGSLAIGGFLSAVAVFSGLELYILVLGLPYVVTSLSDIIQVVYFKKTKKRVFLMAPLHHHFEKMGKHENKIVVIYIIITILLGVITYLLSSVLR